MAYYRLYFMDPRSGHIRHYDAFEAEDDDRAIALAEPRRRHEPIELWCLGRKVARWEAVGPLPPVPMRSD